MSEEAKQAARDLGLDNNRSALLKAADEPTPEAQVAVLQRIAEDGRVEHLFVLGRPLPKPEDIRLAMASRMGHSGG